MPSFTVHVPQDDGDLAERAERTAIVRDGFSLSALLFGPIYLLRHRAWVPAAVWVIAVLALGGFCAVTHMPRSVEIGLGLLVVLFTGLEAGTLRRHALQRRGFDVADVVDGANRQDAERAFFRAATQRGLPPRRTVVGGGPAVIDEPVIGLFPDAGPRR